jgi:hypothetical protein
VQMKACGVERDVRGEVGRDLAGSRKFSGDLDGACGRLREGLLGEVRLARTGGRAGEVAGGGESGASAKDFSPAAEAGGISFAHGRAGRALLRRKRASGEVVGGRPPEPPPAAGEAERTRRGCC